MKVKALYSVILAAGLIGGTVSVASAAVTNGAVITKSVGTEIKGEFKQWHAITLEFDGPNTKEDASKNPFTDYRLNVTFKSKDGKHTLVVPGFYAADGNAAETSASEGNKWQVRFSAPATGEWTYTASFRTGTNVAIDLNVNAGSADSTINGKTGSFSVAKSDKSGRDFRGKGRLEYVGQHYLRFAETGEVFLKAGSDSPENLLAYDDFDATLDRGRGTKSWAAHSSDYDASSAKDYTWKNGKGSELLGAIKYLSDQGMNAFSFLPFSLDGDSDNIYPHLQLKPNDTDWDDVHHTRFDVSKMEQWEKIFSYADKMGMYLHFKLQETENDHKMDGGNCGLERKMYLREMVARFGHHLALNWNLGEENTQSTDARRQMAQYVLDLDPYNSNIVLHTYPGQQDSVYTPLLGSKSELTGASIQIGKSDVHGETLEWIEKSANAGKKWVVANDEQGGATDGVKADAGYQGNSSDNRDEVRHRVLWGNLMAGGAGVELYFGYQIQHDLSCEDFRSRANKWKDARIMLNFFNKYLPFAEMKSMDSITSDNDDYVFGKAGEVYAVYLPARDGNTNINLPSGSYSVQWYNPRTGAELTAKKAISNSISAPDSNDWVALITNDAATIVPTNKGGGIDVGNPDDGGGTNPPSTVAYDLDATDTFTNISVSGFSPAYVDASRDALAIDASKYKDKFAAATTVFNGATGTYDFTIRTLTETDGESTYKLVVNGVVKGTFQNPETSTDYAPATKTWKDISIDKGDTIRVEFSSHTNGKIAEGSSTAYSRGRWTSLKLATVDSGGGDIDPPTHGATFEEKNGVVIIEAENTALSSSWAKQSGLNGFTGESYIEYVGGNSMGSVNESSKISYKVQINTPGTYQFKWHSRNGAGAHAADAENDTWLNIEADDFYGMSGSSKVPCKDEYMKVWIQSMNSWSWNSNGEHHGANGLGVYATFDKPGVYTINLAGRSKGHVIDRIIMFKDGVSAPTDLNLEQTLAVGGGNNGGGNDGGGNDGGGNDGGGNDGGLTDMVAPTMDAYLQGSKGYNTNELRVESGKRTSYLSFDIDTTKGDVESMELIMTVGSDAGNGTISVSQAEGGSWNESNLAKGNAPAAGTVLAKSTGSYATGQTVSYDISDADVKNGSVSLVVTMANGGNDVSFASREDDAMPVLVVKYRKVDATPANMPAFGTAFSLKANSNGKFICADKILDSANGTAYANRTVVGEWETFTIVDAGNGFVAFKAHATGQYLSVSSENPYRVKANGSKINGATKFEWVANGDDTVSLKSKISGMYVCTDIYLNEDEYPLAANRSSVGAWEKFTWTAK